MTETEIEGETTEPEIAPITFEQLPSNLQQACANAGWTELMPVQSHTIPYLLHRNDLMAQSRTGSGKTGAYLLPALGRIDPNRAECQVLILVPTRELATQVLKDAMQLLEGSEVRAIAVYGGVKYGPQTDGLRGGAHLVVGTPGRILDHLQKKNFNLHRLRLMIFDEADRMLSMGFYPDMRRLQNFLPNGDFTSAMFSATFPPNVLRLSEQFLKEPVFLNLSSDHIHVTEVEHIYYHVPGMDKDRSLINIIESENPSNAIIFCNTRQRVHYVTVILQRYGFDADELSSDLSQAAREVVMKRIRNGSLRFLVATDVAARGIDIPALSHVFQYEPPEEIELYIHRAGRTGRAGAAGVAISLVNSLEEAELMKIARRYEISLQKRSIPTEDDVYPLLEQRAVALLESRLNTRDKLQSERMGRFTRLAKELAGDEETIASLAMLLDDFYCDNFHKTQSLQEVPPATEEQKMASPSRKRRSGNGRSRRN